MYFRVVGQINYKFMALHIMLVNFYKGYMQACYNAIIMPISR